MAQKGRSGVRSHGPRYVLERQLAAAEFRAEQLRKEIVTAVEIYCGSISGAATNAIREDYPEIAEAIDNLHARCLAAESRAEQAEKRLEEHRESCRAALRCSVPKEELNTAIRRAEQAEQRLARVREVLDLVAKDDFCAYTHTARKALKELEEK
jgi:broad specificity phosphatase PhoE